MPIYEYKCENCGTMNEFIVFRDDEQLECKTCHSANLRKLMSVHNTPWSSGSLSDNAGGCCGSPNTCGTPGSCCGG